MYVWTKVQFFYFNYGFISSKDLRLKVNILIKESEQPTCYHELIISNDGDAYVEAKAFQDKFILNPEKYRNIKLFKE